MSVVAIKSYKYYHKIAFRPVSNRHLVSLALSAAIYFNIKVQSKGVLLAKLLSFCQLIVFPLFISQLIYCWFLCKAGEKEEIIAVKYSLFWTRHCCLSSRHIEASCDQSVWFLLWVTCHTKHDENVETCHTASRVNTSHQTFILTSFLFHFIPFLLSPAWWQGVTSALSQISFSINDVNRL